MSNASNYTDLFMVIKYKHNKNIRENYFEVLNENLGNGHLNCINKVLLYEKTGVWSFKHLKTLIHFLHM